MVKNGRDWFNCSSIELFRIAAIEARFKLMISNLQLEIAPKKDKYYITLTALDRQ